MTELLEILKRYEALPPSAVVSSKAAAAILGVSERVVVKSTIVWPEDKDGNIIKPSWWVDEDNTAASLSHTPRATDADRPVTHPVFVK